MSMASLALVLSAVVANAQQPEPDLVIGVASGPAASVFGRIADVALDGSGNIFVLDTQALEIRWFGPDGEYRGRGGGAGSGEGELRSPQSLAVKASGEVLVLDPLNGRIARYSAGNSALIHAGDIAAPPAMDFCVLGEELYLLRLQPDSVITVLDASGRITAAWGTLVEPLPGHELPPEAIRQEMDNRARVSCDAATGTVTLLYDRIPLVRRFSRDGRLLWEIELEDYHRVRDVRTEDDSGWTLAPDPDSGTAHSGRSITAGVPGTLIVTLYEGSTEGGGYEARVLDAATGDQLDRLRVPMVITEYFEAKVIGHAVRPVPRVMRHDARVLLGR